MTVRTTKLGGTDWGNEVLTPADLNDTIEALPVYESSDTAKTSMTGVTETKIAQCTIAANKVTTGVLVIASGKAAMSGSGGSQTNTIKLYAGTSTTATSNTLQHTIIRTSANGADDFQTGWTIAFFVTGLTWSSTNYVQITGASTSASLTVTCDSVVAVSF